MASFAPAPESPRRWKWTWPLLIGISLGSAGIYAGLAGLPWAVLLATVLLAHELGDPLRRIARVVTD